MKNTVDRKFWLQRRRFHYGSRQHKTGDSGSIAGLFSVQGFEATSISQIAGAVGIRKASLYSHFESKQAILDALVKDVLDHYEEHSIFARANWDKFADTEDKQALTPDAAAQMIQGQIRYILHDPHISKARKMLVIEQFQNPELAKLQTRQNYSDVMQYFTGLIKYLIRQGVLREDDPEIMAAQLCLPITTWINLCDREPDREVEVMELIGKHIRQFFKLYQPEAR
ncbi:MAG: TetR/AcrR family transcriptional regulator [Christensenellales bacterium]